ncbi:MAG: hypothetical protein M3133_10425, partial [Actinomycetota bacterium]|nr:hypothetical protein [Actinomycetota bacterium]
EADPDAPVEDVMREGPSTVRPSEEVEALLKRMQDADSETVVVTRSDGTLLGLFERTRAQQALQEADQYQGSRHEASGREAGTGR